VTRSILLWIAVCLLASPAATPGAFAQDATAVAATASASVCAILVQTNDQEAYSGTGFLVANSLVLTANHVVQNARRILVKFPGEAAVDARVVSQDGASDLAVLSVPPLPIRSLSLADSDTVQTGQPVIAIGYPRLSALGAGAPSVTEGIISAIRPGQLQMQVPVSPGNSGGPLLTLRGDVVGVVEATLGGQQQSINFATPINAAKPLLGAAALGPGFGSRAAPPSQPAPGPVTAQAPAAQVPLSQSVTDALGRFTMGFPNDWQVVTGSQGMIALLGAGPAAGTGIADRPTVNVVTETLTHPLSAQEYAAAAERFARVTLHNYTVIQESSATVHGRPAYYRYMTWETNTGVTLYQLQVYFTAGQTGFVVTGSTVNERERVLRDMPVITRIIETFQLAQTQAGN
jgi:S1-C subfamily serine protease